MLEYYIRQPEEPEARGPYTLDKLKDLVEKNKADRDTLYYDENQEEWINVLENADLRDGLFPDKQHLSLKAKEVADSLNTPDAGGGRLTVDEMLAAAEGKTEDTRHLKKRETNMERAASLSLPALGVMMLLSAVSNLYPSIDLIQLIRDEKDYMLILQEPILIVGVIDAFLALCCFLSVTDAFPIVRFRVMLGLGYFGYINWAWGELPQLFAVIAACLGAYIATLTLNLYLMVLAILLGILGMGALAAFSFL